MNEENNPISGKDETVNTSFPTTDTEGSKNQEIQNDVLSETNTEATFDATSLTNKSLEELVSDAKSVFVQTPKIANTRFKIIKRAFYELYNQEKKSAEEAFKSENEDEEAEFKFAKESLVEDIKDVEQKVKQAIEEEKIRIENEKKANLAKKEALLKRLEELVSQDETLDSIKEVKEIQKDWKTIRVLPSDKVADLWDRYNILQNKFYDNHSIHIELKELDRQKNLEAKIDLTKKVEEVHNEMSLKRSFILLNKYHEEFKNTGPVPKESQEPIWEAFKKASDGVYEAKRKIYEQLEAGKEENLEKKQVIVEKANLLNAVKPSDAKGWNIKTKAFEELFDQWKKIGPVPKSNKDAAWTQFNGTRNDFYTERKEYFKVLNAGRTENLKAKEELCVKVEALKDSKDWATTSKEIIKIQGEWKAIGPVPDKVNQAIWKRFRSACDYFFNQKNEAFAGKREEEEANQKTKEELIKKLEELGTKDIDHKKAFAELKEINAEWRATGYVPHKAVKKISKAYEEANNAVYKKYSEQIEAAKSANLSEHYKNLKDTAGGDKQLEREEAAIKRRISSLNEEIASIERNMSFFAKSKTADKMLKDFEQKIEKAQKQISKLKQELKAIKNAKKPKEEPVSTVDTDAPAESTEE